MEAGKHKLISHNVIQTHINITKKNWEVERNRKKGRVFIFHCGYLIHTTFDKSRIKPLNILFKVNKATTRILKH